MTLPRWIFAPAALALALLAIPLVALLADVPWLAIPALLSSPEGSSALWLSLRTSLLATAIIVVLGVPLALALVRLGKWGKVLRVLVVVPMTMPPVVGGLALLAAFGRRSPLGNAFPQMADFLAFSTPAVVVAQVFVGMPFLVLSTEAAVRSVDFRYVEAARALGAGRSRILFRVLLPLVAPAIISGTALAMARALGEFGATLTFAGSLPGVTRTLPLAIYLQREANPELALALAAILLALATALVTLAGLTPWLLTHLRRSRAHTPPHLSELPPAPATTAQQFQVAHVSVSTDGWTAVIGPNGAGKTTLLRRLAGLGPGQPLDGAVLLTQYPALFPHMSVLDNVRFACRDSARAWQELDAVNASDLADRFPHEISGGQAARVALARALATDPQVLLLDEPLAAVDPASASALREVLRTRLRDLPVLHVTHDPVDVAMLATQLLVVEGGEVTAVGSPVEVLAQPQSAFVAEFAGMSCVSGSIEAGSVRTPGGLIAGSSDSGLTDGSPATVLFSPRSVMLTRSPANSSARNTLRARVGHVSHHGSYVRVSLHDGHSTYFADITPTSASAMQLAPGEEIYAVIKALQVTVVPWCY